MAPFIVDFFRRLEESNSKTREILATKSREILIDIASRGRNVNRERGCALGAVSCPTGAVCLCAYISKPVVTAPPRHYLSHASAPIFIGEVIHEASSSSPLLPYPPWAHKQRALSRESRGEGEERLFHSHSPIKIVRTSILPRAIRPLPFFFLVPLIDKEFVRVGRYGKTARSAFESSYVATW